MLSKEEQALLAAKIEEYTGFLQQDRALFTTEQLEEAMQKIMDAYAGGIGSQYQYNEN